MPETRRVVVAVVLSLGLAGCSNAVTENGPIAPGPGASADAAARGIVLTAELDPTTGAVVLPYDRFVQTADEADLLASGHSALLALCARENGVAFTAMAPRPQPIYSSEHYWGPWTTGQAERFGFVKPQTDADLAANGITVSALAAPPGGTPSSALTVNDSLSEDDWKVVDECGDSSDITSLTDALSLAGPWIEPIQAITDSIKDRPEAREAIDELSECFQSAGLRPDPDKPGTVVGADLSVISEEQIQLALAVVQCKEQTRFTNRMADLEASLQAPVVVEYADELIQRRKALDDALDLARSIFAQHPDLPTSA